MTIVPSSGPNEPQTAALRTRCHVVHHVLLPALMRLIGDRCWWMPGWLERRVPRLALE